VTCQERERLENEHTEAEAAFSAARDRLQEKSGISLKHEYEQLCQTVSALRERAGAARSSIDRHIQEHRCERMDQASSESSSAISY
jgi:hypothetical protein